MKKALVFFLAVAISLCFAFTGGTQQNTASGPAKGGKQLTKGRYVQTKKKQPTGGASVAQQPSQAATPAKQTVSSSSTAPTKTQNGVVGPGSAAGKKLTKGKFTKK